VDRVFCVAGESYLPILDAIHDLPEMDVVTCRHEGSAAFMALADAKLTCRAGVCLVSRGPGATNAAIGVHAAAEDATPLVLMVGSVGTQKMNREPFQGVDCANLFGGLAKAVWTVHSAPALAEFVARAFRLAESGTPGPVVLELPENILEGSTPAVAAHRPALAAVNVAERDLESVHTLLERASRPLVLAGSRLCSDLGRALLRQVAERHGLPVVTSNKNQHLLPNRHPNYAGHLHNATPKHQLDALSQADLVLAIGSRLDGVTTRGHRFPTGEQNLVHIYPDAARIGTYHETKVGIACEPIEFLRQTVGWSSSDMEERQSWLAQLHQIEADKAVWHPFTADDGIVFGEVVASLDELTGGEVQVVVDSGTFTSWVYRYLRLGTQGHLLGIGSSAMGFGVGAAVAAALRSEGRPVVAFVGDGGFLMNSGELITACARELPVVYVLANNGSYGTIRLHQEKTYPERVVATDLTNPDFAKMAESFGALGLRVDSPEQVRPALTKALESSGPAVLDIATSLKHITAYTVLGASRAVS
jgi:acetolactate synthase-1/2/3 large subunit